MIQVSIEQNVHDGSFKCVHAFNNKFITLYADEYNELVNKIEVEFRKVFDHAFDYQIIQTRFLPT